MLEAVQSKGQSSKAFDFIVDHKIESSFSKGQRLEVFTINVYIEETKVVRIKKSIEDIRLFDKEVRRCINYDIPSLSEISRLQSE